MAVSAEKGVEAFHLTTGKLDSVAFCRIFKEIAKRGTWCVCLMDNWSVHHSKYTKHKMLSDCLSPVYNVRGMPDLNAIERVFS
jgi:hypothetical protein